MCLGLVGRPPSLSSLVSTTQTDSCAARGTWILLSTSPVPDTLAAVSLAGGGGLRPQRAPRWPAFAFCPFPLSCQDVSEPFPLPWAAPGWPCEDTAPGFLPGIGELCPYLSLAQGSDFGSAVRCPLEASRGQDRKGCSPVCKPSLQSQDSSRKSVPISTQCRKAQLPERLLRHGSTLSGGQCVLLMGKI